ncbi:MAG: PAS domain S-box protein [Candidatus Brocadiales bacterium]|nr:PAS domain S-box protein [Candidatus Brocadiales bacterium]
MSPRVTEERFWELILQNVPMSILVFDRNLKVIFANQNFLEKTRQNINNVMGKTVEDIFPSVLLKYTQLPDMLKRVFQTGKGIPGREMVYRAPGIPYRVYYYSLNPLKGEEEAIEKVMLLMEDITEQTRLREEVRRAERHLASIVESANDIVVSMDPSGVILTWNSAGEIISGFSSWELTGRHISTIFLADHAEELRDILGNVRSGDRLKHVEANLVAKGGKEIPVSWNFSPMKDEKEEIIGIVGVGRDLTERKQLEAQLIQSAKLASLGVLAGGIAHEIRNPLGISSAASQLFLENPKDEKLREECAQRIYSGIQRASQIIEGLLKFARPSSKRMEPTDVNKALEEVLELTGKQITTQQITIKKNLSLFPLPLIIADEKLLKQVFLNMILNASNAMPQGGTLIIRTERMNEYVRIIFCDTGIGIAEEDLDKIFDPFFTTMPVGKGTGLGLSICYGIVKEHNGTIEVESSLDKGSTFTIKLPVQRQDIKANNG